MYPYYRHADGKFQPGWLASTAGVASTQCTGRSPDGVPCSKCAAVQESAEFKKVMQVVRC